MKRADGRLLSLLCRTWAIRECSASGRAVSHIAAEGLGDEERVILGAAKPAAGEHSAQLVVATGEDNPYLEPLSAANPIGRAIERLPYLLGIARWVATTDLYSDDPDQRQIAEHTQAILNEIDGESPESATSCSDGGDALEDPWVLWAARQIGERLGPDLPNRRYWTREYARAFDACVDLLSALEGRPVPAIAAELGALTPEEAERLTRPASGRPIATRLEDHHATS